MIGILLQIPKNLNKKKNVDKFEKLLLTDD